MTQNKTLKLQNKRYRAN